MFPRRMTIFAGHYGSGKTNLAVNRAVELRRDGAPVTILDLDIVNPYFRTKDSMKTLDALGIPLISSVYANSNVDVPAVPPAAYSAFDNKEMRVVVDVGGDDAGSVVLGRFRERIDPSEVMMLLVINRYRPLTRTPEEVLEVKEEIERASKFSFGGIVNNSNLGYESTAETLLETLPYAQEAARLTRLPVVYHAIREDLYTDMLREKVPTLVPITIYGKEDWKL